MDKKIKESLVIQKDQSDCGPACLLSIVKFYGEYISLERIREICGTKSDGTTLLGLYQGAMELGFKAEGYEASVDALISQNNPIILNVLNDNQLSHFVVCFGYVNDKFIIADPNVGLVYYSKEQLKKKWIDGRCLTLEVTSKFPKETVIKESKKTLFLKLLLNDKRLLIISILLGLISSVLALVFAVFSQQLIDEILPTYDKIQFTDSIIALACLLVLRVVIDNSRLYILLKQSKRFNNRIVKVFFKHLLHLPRTFYDTRRIGDLTARLNDTARIQQVIGVIAGSTVINLFLAIVSVCLLFYYSTGSGVIAIVFIPMYYGFIYSFKGRITKAQKEVLNSYSINESNYINTLQGISAVKNFNKQSHFFNLCESVYGRLQEKVFSLGKLNIRLSIISGITGVIFLTIILSYNIFQVYNGLISVGQLIAIFGITTSLLPTITSLALVTIQVTEAKIAFNRMHELIEIPKELIGVASCKKINFNSLELRQVSFGYRGRMPLLKEITLKVKKGEIVGLIGESGSGKSTIAKIIEGFYRVDSGEIFINNESLFSEIDLSSWRNVLGVVPQEIHVFNGDISYNISLNFDNYKNVKHFCKKYGFDTFFKSLPEGINTLVGEEGINLSGGQRQILGIARALFYNPKFLLLDESTSAIDPSTEEVIRNLLSGLREHLGIVFISHKLDFVRTFTDKCYKLEKGIIKTQAQGIDVN